VGAAEWKFIIFATALQKEWAEQSWSTDFRLPKARINSRKTLPLQDGPVQSNPLRKGFFQ